MLDPTEFGNAMAAIVRDAQAPLLERIKALEARQPERGEKGDLGPEGKAGLQGDPGAAGEKGEPGERGLAGEKGEAGINGRDADPIDVKEVVAELLAGDEIKTLVELHVAEGVHKHFEANPIQHGKDGASGERGIIGERGEKGDAGNDGIGLAGAMIDRDGSLIITTTKGDPIKLGIVVGKNGDPGKDGADFTDCTLDYDGERGLIIRSKSGEIVKKLPIPMDKGYWREGMLCEKADILTHNGNAWIALRDTKAKPCIENKGDWRIFARKGRDGTDGTNGRDLGPQPTVKLGANGSA